MKSNDIHFNKSVVSPSCQCCHKTVIAKATRTVFDDNRSLAITAWTCAECHSVNQEVRILSKGGQVLISK